MIAIKISCVREDICEQFGIVKYKKGRKKRVLVTSKEGVNEGYGPAYSGEELTLKMRSQKYNNSQRSSGDNPKKNRGKKTVGRINEPCDSEKRIGDV